MQKVRISLRNCYGIKALDAELDFARTAAYAIYAANGVMKSSLAQTFQDASQNQSSEDRIFPERKTSRSIMDDQGAAIDGESIFVVKPYDEEYGPTEKTSTLLVDPTLRREYEQLHVDIDKAKVALLRALAEQSQSRTNFEEEIAAAFTSTGDFDLAVSRIRVELERQDEAPYSEVQCGVIFNQKVIGALERDDIRGAIEEYILRYNELLEASTFFKRGTFDYYNAAQIAKSLASNGFFEARHTVNLKSSGRIHEITTQEELEAVVAEEKTAILKDEELRRRFDQVANRLQRNAELRAFCSYLQEHEALLSRMHNLASFKEDVLKSYIKANFGVYLELMTRLN